MPLLVVLAGVLEEKWGIKEATMFSVAWQKCRDTITKEDLEAKYSTEKETVCLLAHILYKAAEGSSTYRTIIEELLAQMPYLLSDKELFTFPFTLLSPRKEKSIEELIDESGDWAHKILPLISARNAFFEELTALKNKKPLLESDLPKIHTLAHNATTAGYQNAFYDLAMFLEGFDELKGEVEKCLFLLPQASCHYEEAVSSLQVEYFSKAMGTSAVEKRHLLEKATALALKFSQGRRIVAIQEIADCYIRGDTHSIQGIDRSIVPEYMLEVLEGKPPSVYMSLFDNLKHTMTLEAENQRLKEENSKLKSEVQETNALLKRTYTQVLDKLVPSALD